MRLFLILLFISFPACAEEYRWKVKGIADGDTINIEIKKFPKELPLKVRLYGVDTPEYGWRAKCDSERELAQKAKEFTSKAINEAKKIYFTDIEWDKYGGRIIAKTFVDGQDLSQLLIDNNLARPYFGGKKSGWCN